MKTLLATVALIAATLPALAGPTENITGCATAPAEGSNFTVRLDPTCALSTDKNDGSGLFKATASNLWIDVITPDEEAAK